MYCPTCGNQIRSGAKFCPFCGTSLASFYVTSRQTAQKTDHFADITENPSTEPVITQHVVQPSGSAMKIQNIPVSKLQNSPAVGESIQPSGSAMKIRNIPVSKLQNSPAVGIQRPRRPVKKKTILDHVNNVFRILLLAIVGSIYVFLGLFGIAGFSSTGKIKYLLAGIALIAYGIWLFVGIFTGGERYVVFFR